LVTNGSSSTSDMVMASKARLGWVRRAGARGGEGKPEAPVTSRGRIRTLESPPSAHHHNHAIMARFTHLPLDLLPHILEKIRKTQALAQLCRVNRTFYTFAVPLLYEQILVFPWHQSGKQKVSGPASP
jgi:hypothetical protein